MVSFTQKDFSSPTRIIANIKNLNPNSLHGLHIHKYGDLTEGCKTAGPHFNPKNVDHGGAFDKIRHVGDLGNIKTDEKGNGFLTQENDYVTLFGDESIFGRSVVVHAGEDDLGRGGNEGSRKTGNSGSRLACGVIGKSDSFKSII